MPPQAIIFAIIVGIVIFCIYYFSAKNRIKRKLKNAPHKPLSNFKNKEIAKVQGTIVAVDTPLRAPLSHRQCVAYSIEVDETKYNGNNSYRETIIKDSMTSKYLIKDGDKYAIINAKSIKSHIILDKNYSSGFLNDATTTLEDYLNEKGHKSEGFLKMNKSLEYKEGILEIGEKVTAFGKGVWRKGSEFQLPETYDEVLELTPTSNESVYLSDDPTTLSEPVSLKKSNTLIT